MNLLAVFPAFRAPTQVAPIGGGEISNRELLTGLATFGHNVAIYALNAGRTGWEAQSELTVIDGGIGRPGLSRKGMQWLRSRNLLAGWLNNYCPDVILATPSTVGLAMRISKKKGAPVAVLVRARRDLTARDRGSFMRKVARRAFYGASDWMATDHLIANSNFMKNLCNGLGFRGKGWVIYPPVNTPIAETGWPEAVEKIGMVGGSVQKGGDIFLGLAARIPKAQFLMVGDRSVEPGKSLVAGNVVRIGWVNDPIAIVDQCDAILMPTKFDESFGRTAVEAVRRKKLVAASRVDGLNEAIGESSLLVDADDLDAWEKRVNHMISSPSDFYPAMSVALQNSLNFFLQRQVEEFESALVSIRSSKRN